VRGWRLEEIECVCESEGERGREGEGPRESKQSKVRRECVEEKVRGKRERESAREEGKRKCEGRGKEKV